MNVKQWYRKNRFVIKMGLFAIGAGTLYLVSKSLSAKAEAAEEENKYADLKRSGTQSVYSFLGSQLHLVLDDAIAEGYNRFVDAFAEAQEAHRKNRGHDWKPNEALWIDVTEDSDVHAHNAVANIINHMSKVNGKGLNIKQEDCTSDYLVKLEEDFLRELNAAEEE